MKTKPVALADRISFVAIVAVGWALLDVLVYLAFDAAIGIYMTSNPLHRPLMYATTIIAFAFLQRHLATRYLRVNFRHWLRWTLAGVIVGALCHALFTAIIPPPSEFWWQRRFNPPPAAADLLVKDVYHALRWFFRFGLVAFFQYFALPRHLQGRRFWLLAALASGPLWLINSVLAALIQAFAIDHMATLTTQRQEIDEAAEYEAEAVNQSGAGETPQRHTSKADPQRVDLLQYADQVALKKESSLL